ncbi:hypothetical protein T09_4733 [Trichinella sp. T9]|nr:hypothetical protein T09_4733 [Trichinella sp. T9]
MKMNETFSVILSSVQTEKQLKHSIQVVSRWKAFYNETPVEFISEEAKAGRGITQKINEMLSVTPVNCSERNNTDLVGVTWPGAGGRKSRVGRGQYPHPVGQIVISAYGSPGRERDRFKKSKISIFWGPLSQESVGVD